MKAISVIFIIALVSYSQSVKMPKVICDALTDNITANLDTYTQQCKSELFWAGHWWSAIKLKASESSITTAGHSLCDSRRRLILNPITWTKEKLNQGCKGAVSQMETIIRAKMICATCGNLDKPIACITGKYKVAYKAKCTAKFSR